MTKAKKIHLQKPIPFYEDKIDLILIMGSFIKFRFNVLKYNIKQKYNYIVIHITQ